MKIDDRVNAILCTLIISMYSYEPYQIDDPIKVFISRFFDHTRVHVVLKMSIVDLKISIPYNLLTHWQPYRVESK